MTAAITGDNSPCSIPNHCTSAEVPRLSVSETLQDRCVIVCCGAGGVGKTTISAALAMNAALARKRAVVVTIDPAKRLADALGITKLSNTPTRIDGPWEGTLHALMLDAKSTFDEVVRLHADNDSQAERIFANRFYRNVATKLSGTQDYMAVEKLNELHNSGDFDLVVVDTPPTRDALAFLEAPRFLTRLLNNPIYRLVTAPRRGPLKPLNTAAQKILTRLARIVGAGVVQGAIAFFQAFEGMEEGFRQRATDTTELLHGDRSAFVLVASPRGDTIAETRYFLDRLRAVDLDAAVLIVNRALPALSTSLSRSAELAASLEGTSCGSAAQALVDHRQMNHADEKRIGELTASSPDAAVARVPLLASDVHDVQELTRIARFLA